MNICEQALQKHKLCVHNTLSRKGWCVMCIQKVWEDEIIFKRMWSLIKMPFAPSDIGIYFPSWSTLWGSGSIIVSKWNKLHIASNVHDSMNGVVLQAVHKNLLTSSVNPPQLSCKAKLVDHASSYAALFTTLPPIWINSHHGGAYFSYQVFELSRLLFMKVQFPEGRRTIFVHPQTHSAMDSVKRYSRPCWQQTHFPLANLPRNVIHTATRATGSCSATERRRGQICYRRVGKPEFSLRKKTKQKQKQNRFFFI